ncbi:MAG: twitching motility protein PilT [Candidatus Sumerlaea sp.]|nr:MAG: twitching motility protein PilT [Candidatus Sumerlaea sp.]
MTYQLEALLAEVVRHDASDLYLTAEAKPMIAVHGQLTAIGELPLTPEDTVRLAQEAMTPEQWDEFRHRRDLNFAIKVAGHRFRFNAYYQRSTVAMVARLIRQEIRSFEELGLPQVLADLVMSPRGIILVTGATGTGKSTTLATMIDWRNRNSSGHIVTIEDPIEFTHEHKGCVVSQREVGIDTESFHEALRSALRQAPQVILIGEIRDTETAMFALHASETGHLVLSTLHTNNANQTLERLLNLFPKELERQLLTQLSLNLRAIVSQRLVPRIGGGRVVVVEILLTTPRVQELIAQGDVEELKGVMAKSAKDGMQTFDMHLYELVKAGIVEEEVALRYADSANDLKLRLRGIGGKWLRPVSGRTGFSQVREKGGERNILLSPPSLSDLAENHGHRNVPVTGLTGVPSTLRWQRTMLPGLTVPLVGSYGSRVAFAPWNGVRSGP